MTAVEVDRLVAAIADPGLKYATLRCRPRYAALVFTGCWLGPRWNEAIGLRLCDVNPDRHEVTFGRIVVNQNGSVTFTERFSKTEDVRTVPCPAPVIEALQQQIETYVRGGDREAFLFTRATGTHPLRQGFLRDATRPVQAAAGLAGRRITWLTFRHTAASLMFDAGLSLFEVQQRLGHKDPTLTARVYTHLMRERFDEGRGKLEAYMAKMREHGGESPRPQE
ncbi:MAG TPA: site-specific integrase [Mycobacteriales bacterium]|nr:site-specific integrase [Mycobacteriales bacterium]